MSQPENCGQCRSEFMCRPALQAEVRHEVAKFGEQAGIALLRERLEADHDGHRR